MKIAHISDLHIYRTPTLGQLLSKRLLGFGNLHVAGRCNHFCDESVELMVRDLILQKPDLVICTGDISALGTPQEFQAAKKILDPLIKAIPFVLIPGNHDSYTLKAKKEQYIRHLFNNELGSSWPSIKKFDDITIIGLDTTYPHPVKATGIIDEQQLNTLSQILSEINNEYVILLTHFPLRNYNNEPYEDSSRKLVNRLDLEKVIIDSGKIDLILHGHEHHGFKSTLGTIPIFDPGAGGYTESEKRTSYFNIYNVTNRKLIEVSRFKLVNGTFQEEEEGPYSKI